MPENTTSGVAVMEAGAVAGAAEAGLVVGGVMGRVMVSEVHTLTAKVVSKKPEPASGPAQAPWRR